jgi:hypothetical protein
MANISMNLDLMCELRKQRQSLFAMPSFRATPISPYPEYTKEQLDMRRKAEILQYAGNRMNTKTNSLTKTGRFTQIITGKYQSRSYTTTYNENVSYKYDKLLNLNSVVIERVPVYSVFDCSQDDLIPVPTSSSDVPGPIINLYNDTSIPLYNLTGILNNAYAVTDVIETEKWKINYIGENAPNFYTTTYNNGNKYDTEPTETILSYIYITNAIDQSEYIYEMYVPIGIHFEGKYKGNSTTNGSGTFNPTITLTIPDGGFNPQILIGSNVLNINRTVEFQDNANNISDVSFNITDKHADFSGTMYIGMLKISNIRLYTAVGYIYTVNIITNVTFSTGSSADTEKLATDYLFTYGLYYNLSDAIIKTTTNCTINHAASSEPRGQIQLTSSSNA